MSLNINLSEYVKTTTLDKIRKNNAYSAAVAQMLKENQLSMSEIDDLWAQYRHLIDNQTGYAYNHIPIRLPRIKVINKQQKEKFRDSNNIEIDGIVFSKESFYEDRNFRLGLRKYYRKLGYSISLYKTKSGWMLKIYMN